MIPDVSGVNSIKWMSAYAAAAAAAGQFTDALCRCCCDDAVIWLVVTAARTARASHRTGCQGLRAVCRLLLNGRGSSVQASSGTNFTITPPKRLESRRRDQNTTWSRV